MKKDKIVPTSNVKKNRAGTNPINQFKKGSKGATLASVNNIIGSAVDGVKAKSGRGLANEGTDLDYNEER